MRQTLFRSLLGFSGLLTAIAPSYAQGTHNLGQIFVEGYALPNDNELRSLSQTKNISVMTAEEIEGKGYTTIVDALQQSASVNIPQSKSGEYNLDMRGSGNTKTRVHFMVNGISTQNNVDAHMGTPVNVVNINDIERIEIIPGGSTVLYGVGAPGGIVNVVTKTGPRTPYAEAGFRYGSYASKRFDASFGQNLGNNLFIKGSVAIDDRDAYRHGEHSEGHFGSFGLSYKFNDVHSLDLNWSSHVREMMYKDDPNLDQLGISKRYTTGRTTHRKTYRDSYEAHWRIKSSDNLEFRLSPYFTRTKYRTLPSRDVMFINDRYGVKSRGTYRYQTGIGNGTLIFGYDYQKEEADYDLAGLGMSQTGIETETHSIFFHNHHRFNPYFSLGAGYRYERLEKDVNNSTRWLRNDFGGERTENNHAFEITPAFHYSDTGQVYFKYERGFVSPQGNRSYHNPTGRRNEPVDLDTETYNTFELGFRDTFWKVFSVQATAYFTKNKDEAQAVWMGGGHGMKYRYENIGETERKGLELNLEQSLLNDSLRLYQGLSWVKTEITDGGYNRVSQGRELRNVPRYKITLGAEYDINPHLAVFANARFQGKQYLSYDHNEKHDSHEVVDIGIKANYKGWHLRAGVNNLFDKTYYHSMSRQASPRDRTYYIADGRNYYAELRYKF